MIAQSLALAILLGVSPAQLPGDGPVKQGTKKGTASKPAKKPPGVLEQLYALIWPLGRFDGDPNAAIALSTQKGDYDEASPQLFIVHSASNEVLEIPSGNGAQSIAVCPGESRIFFQRGPHLFGQQLTPAFKPDGPATELEGADLGKNGSLEGCTRDGNRWLLWVTTNGGEPLFVNARSGALEKVPAWVTSLSSEELGRRRDLLRRLYAVRPDGLVAAVNDATLSIIKIVNGKGQRRDVETKAPVVHFAAPVCWLGPASPYVLAIGFKERR